MKLTEKRFKYTFFTSIFVGLAAHLFALTNVLQNYDNISQTPVGVGTGVTSGRWVIELLSQLHIKYGVNYNIPMVNGLIAIFLLSVSLPDHRCTEYSVCTALLCICRNFYQLSCCYQFHVLYVCGGI